MSQPAHRADAPDRTPVSGVRVQRARPQSQVVVRAGAASAHELRDSLMPRVPTLVGYSPDAAAGRNTLVGLTAPHWDDDEPMEPLPARPGTPGRAPPEILIEDVDHELAERYRREAQRILAAGFFS